jgi:hypothetical protein
LTAWFRRLRALGGKVAGAVGRPRLSSLREPHAGFRMPPKYTKKPWLPSEDQLLLEAVTSLGAPEFAVKGQEKSGVRWTDIAKLVPDRAAKQCRERWRNHLDPGVSRAAWTESENEILLARYEQFGSMWAEIASGLPGRADNGCKNQWNKLMGWGSSSNRPRKAAQTGESPPAEKKARRKGIPGSMLGRPASRGEGGAAAGRGGVAGAPVRAVLSQPSYHYPWFASTDSCVDWWVSQAWTGGALVAAGRPAPASLVNSGSAPNGASSQAASAATAAAGAAAVAPTEVTTTASTTKNRISTRRRGRATQQRQEAPPPMRPPVPDRKRAAPAPRRKAATAAPPLHLVQQPAAEQQAAASLPQKRRRDWEMYTAAAHRPAGSPREPKEVPPPARLLHRSRAASAAAVDPAEAMVLELTGHVLADRIPDTDRGHPTLATSPATSSAGAAAATLEAEASALSGLADLVSAAATNEG